jgi:predicted ester cyclase
MSANENKEFIRKYLAALSGKPKTAELVDVYVEEQPLKDHIAAAETGFPLYEMDIVDMIAEGDQVAVKARMHGAHKGIFNGIPATGRQVDSLFHIRHYRN